MIDTLKELGEKLVKCNMHCEGVKNEPQKGIIPRCLILEPRKGEGTSIMVGLNPGKCDEEERNYYLDNGIKFASIADYFFKSHLHERPYFSRMRQLVTTLGFKGDILWTNLAKCECSGKNGDVPMQTLRVCINRFLRKEIDVFQSSTMFALGNKAFEFCALSFPEHFIVGIPHPTGSHGDFVHLHEKITVSSAPYLVAIAERKDTNSNYRAIRLVNV